jgi:hypothetical protein
MDVLHNHRQSAEFESLPTFQDSSERQFHKGPHRALLNDKDGTHVQEIPVSKQPSNTKPSALRNFITETLCLAVATASLLGLVAILRKYDNRESPEWHARRTSVTLNTVISILSTVFQGSLLMPVAQSISRLCWTWYTKPRPLVDVCYYDSASRGALGSIRLLLRLRFLY